MRAVLEMVFGRFAGAVLAAFFGLAIGAMVIGILVGGATP